MSERFETWPHDTEGIVREALREYVGDGDGEDEKVLTAYLDQERAVARREGVADGMRSTASWLEGGTPRVYGFQHPCDPPGTITKPSDDSLRLLYAVDAIREAADRIENGVSDE